MIKLFCFCHSLNSFWFFFLSFFRASSVFIYVFREMCAFQCLQTGTLELTALCLLCLILYAVSVSLGQCSRLTFNAMQITNCGMQMCKLWKLLGRLFFVCKFITTIGHRSCICICVLNTVWDRRKLTLLSTTSPLNKTIALMSILSSIVHKHMQPYAMYGCSNDLIESFRMQYFSSRLFCFFFLHLNAVVVHQAAMNWIDLLQTKMIIHSLAQIAWNAILIYLW